MKSHFSFSRGFILPMTLLAIVGLFILMMGLIAMLSLERKTARSYSDATRADFALQSGLAEAISTLSEISSRDDSLVFRLEDPVEPVSTLDTITREQFFTYGSVFDTANSSWRVIPFFSGSDEVTTTPAANKPNAPNTDILRSSLTSYVGAGNDPIKTLGRLSETDTNVPRAKWVELPQTAGEYKIRYSWWVEDLNGRIDGRTAGSEQRDKGVSTAELGFFTLFKDSATATQGLLASKGDTLRTAASSRLVLDEVDSKVIEPYLTYTPPAATPAVAPVPTIPYGFDYADAGQPAMNLNEAVANKDVEGIAAHITRNLPKFVNDRKGGFPASEDYVKTLAASIIDYADEDSDATTGPGYRGVDSYPFVNTLYDRYEWVSTTGGNLNIKVSTYVELWNLTQQSISGSIEFENQNRMPINIIGEKFFTPVAYPAMNVSLPPNGFKVLFVGEKTYQFPQGNFPSLRPTFPNSTTSNFQLKWNGTLVDFARGGVQRQNSLLNPVEPKWKGNASPALELSEGQSGDPRSSYYVNTFVFANTYASNSCWGGRNKKWGIANANYNEVKVTNWADRGSDSTTGTVPGSDSKVPTGLNYPANQPNLAPAFISNAGSYYSIGELGHIYDPSQWKNVNLANTTANQNAGGGYTLAVGRPEFGKFDTPGLRAAQLADLFYVPRAAPGNSTLGTKININTAPRDVLRTLVAGVTLDEDPALPPMTPAQTQVEGDLFADTVINSRNHAPLRGLSDLALIRRDWTKPRSYLTPRPDTEPYFGGRSHFSPQPPDTWDDAGREDLFRKVVNLVSFQGKSFRIVVAGEALDKNDNLLGRRTKEIHIMFEPERDSAGALVPNGKTIIRKTYEKSL